MGFLCSYLLYQFITWSHSNGTIPHARFPVKTTPLNFNFLVVKESGFETIKMSTVQAQISIQRALNEQLRCELKHDRMKVSQTSNELVKYCEQKVHDDPLVFGVPPSDNPYREKNMCLILWDYRHWWKKLNINSLKFAYWNPCGVEWSIGVSSSKRFLQVGMALWSHLSRVSCLNLH